MRITKYSFYDEMLQNSNRYIQVPNKCKHSLQCFTLPGTFPYSHIFCYQLKLQMVTQFVWVLCVMSRATHIIKTFPLNGHSATSFPCFFGVRESQYLLLWYIVNFLENRHTPDQLPVLEICRRTGGQHSWYNNSFYTRISQSLNVFTR